MLPIIRADGIFKILSMDRVSSQAIASRKYSEASPTVYGAQRQGSGTYAPYNSPATY
jgi:hypothetical protein